MDDSSTNRQVMTLTPIAIRSANNRKAGWKRQRKILGACLRSGVVSDNDLKDCVPLDVQAAAFLADFAKQCADVLN